jgi:radical SAM superfamily enzyme YgiQ (UPF0313 family)
VAGTAFGDLGKASPLRVGEVVVRVLLVQPCKPPLSVGGEDLHVFEPLALEYVAAGVTSGCDVQIVDLRLEPDLPRVLAQFAPDIVGLTAYTVHVNPVRTLALQVKQWNPETLTVVGGHHATIRPEDFPSPAVDLVVRGEGVAAFAEITRRLKAQQGFADIPGVCVSRNGGMDVADPVLVADLDSLPFPDRTLTAGYRKSYFSEWMRPLASVRTSKGCPHRCTFCALWKLSGGRYLRRSPESILGELSSIEQPYVFFADDESLIDAARMTRLAELIRDAGIKKRYYLYARSDTIVARPRLLKLWRSVGLERVFVGLEFFSDRDLAYVGKGSTVDDNRKAVELLHSLGLELHANFIVRPDFTGDDFDSCRDYVRALKLSFAGFSVLTPLPGTDLYDQVKDSLLTDDYDFFDFFHTLLPTTLPLADFYHRYYRLAAGAVPRHRQAGMLRKIRPRDLPDLLARQQRYLHRLRDLYLDYPEELSHRCAPSLQ